MSVDNFAVKQFKTGAALLCSLALLVSFFTPASTAAQVRSGTGGGSTFKAELINIEAAVHETFRYNTTLHNGGSQTRVYELKAAAPEGWNVVFHARGSQLTSINIDGNQSQAVSIEIRPAYGAAPSRYKIPITATAADETLQLDIEAVVKGAYGIELTTPTGLLSDNITEGKQKKIHLVVKNTGTLSLNDISLTAQTPSKWDATFEPSKIEQLAPGKTTDVVATLTVPDKTIAGDYVTTFTAKNANSNAQATFRMTVRTSLLSGWIGLVIILAAIGLVFYLIRKYGRR
jgi:uncharacterized membrane protein